MPRYEFFPGMKVWVIGAALLTLMLAACAGGNTTPRSTASEDAKEAAELQVKLGRGYLEQGKLEIARDRLQQALRLDPRSVNAHTLMAVLNERINRPEQAETFYRKAVKLAPDNGEANNNLGAFLCGQGAYHEADTYFSKALDDPFYSTPVSALVNAGVCATNGGEAGKAEQYFRRILAIQPENATALYEMARMSYFKGDVLRARAFLQRLESHAGNDPRILDLGQHIESRSGDAAAARRYAERLRNDYPDYIPDTTLQGSTSQ